MAAKVNKRFVFILALVVGGLAAIALTVTVVVAGGPRDFVDLITGNDADALIAKAEAYIERGNYKDALKEYARAISRRRNDPQLIITAGTVAAKVKCETTIDAQSYLRHELSRYAQAAKLPPFNPDLHRLRCEREIEIIRELGGSGGRWESLYEMNDDLLVNRPDFLLARRYRGIAYTHLMQSLTGQPRVKRDLAGADLKAWLAENKDDSEGWSYLMAWRMAQADEIERDERDIDKADALRALALEESRKLTSDSPEDVELALGYLKVLLRGDMRDEANMDEARSVVRRLHKLALAEAPTPWQTRHVSHYLTLLLNEVVEPEGHPKTTEGRVMAAQVLAAAIKAHPGDQNLAFAHTELLAEMGRVEEASARFAKFYETPVNDAPLEAMVGLNVQFRSGLRLADQQVVLALREEDTAARQPYLDRARKILDELDEQSPNATLVAHVRGKIAFAEGDWTETTRYLTPTHVDQLRSPSTLNEYVTALRFAGEAAYRQGQTGIAVEYMTKLTELQPRNKEQRFRLIDLLMRFNRLPEAQAQIRKHNELFPDDPDVLYYQGRLLAAGTDMDDKRRAIEMLRKVEGERASDAEVLLIGLYGQTGNEAVALAMARRRLEKDPGDMRPLRQAMLLLEKDNPEAAEALIKNAVDHYEQKLASADNADERRQAQAHLTELTLLAQRVRGEETDALGVLEERIDQLEGQPLEQELARHSLYRQLGKEEEAEAALARAVEISPNDARVIAARFTDAITKAARGDGSMWAQVDDLVELARKHDADKADGHFFAGRAAMARGELGRAISAFEAGLDRRKLYDKGEQWLGDALRLNGEYLRAERHYLNALRQRPENVDAALGLAQVYERQDRGEDALRTMKEARQKAPLHRRVLEYYLEVEQRYGNADVVLETRRNLAERSPDNYDNRRAIVLLLLQQRKQEAALEAAKKLMQEDRDDQRNLLAYAFVLASMGRADDAEKMIIQRRDQLGDKATAEDYLTLAKFYFRTRQIDKAASAYKYAAEIADDPTPIKIELAEVYSERNMHEESAALFREAAAQMPQNRRIPLRIAEELTRAGETDEAEAVLRKLGTGLSPNERDRWLPEVYAREVQVWLKRAEQANADAAEDRRFGRDVSAQQREQEAKNHLREAKQTIDRTLAASKMLPRTQAAAHFQMARILAMEGNHEGAVESIKSAIERNPGNVEQRLFEATLEQRRGATPRAIELLERILAEHPTHYRTRQRLASLYFSTESFDKLSELIVDGETLYPKDPTWPRIAGLMALERKQTRAAITHLQKAFDLNPSPQTTADLAMALIANKQYARADALIRRSPTELRKNAVLQAIRGRALAGLAGQQPEMLDMAIGSFRAALRAAPSNEILRSVFEQLTKSFKMDGVRKVVLGVVDDASTPIGDERRDILLYFLGTQELRSGHPQAGVDRLEALLERIPEDAPHRVHALFELARHYHQAKQPTEAIKLYEQVVKTQPDNSSARNNLAYLLAVDADRPDSALPHAREAARLTPNSAHVLDTLAWTKWLLGVKNNDEAMRQSAIETIKRSTDIKEIAPNCYHRAYMAYREDNDINTARIWALQAKKHAAGVDPEIDALADELLKRLGSN